MGRVHILKYVPTGKIHGVYTDYKKAKDMADNANRNISFWQRLKCSLTGKNPIWTVQTFMVKK